MRIFNRSSNTPISALVFILLVIVTYQQYKTHHNLEEIKLKKDSKGLVGTTNPSSISKQARNHHPINDNGQNLPGDTAGDKGNVSPHLVRKTKLLPLDEYWAKMLHFIPEEDSQNCWNLFTTETSKSVAITPEWEKIRAASNLSNFRGRFAPQHVKQTLTYQELARQNFVHTVCEIGFNVGQSAITWLTTKPDLKVYSFDIGGGSPEKMGKALRKLFPGRFKLTIGDSTKTVRKWIEEGIKCDIVFIDGGHAYPIVHADILNMQKAAAKKHIIVAGASYTLCAPTPVSHPELLLSSPPALALLGLTPGDLQQNQGLLYLSGNRKLPGSVPVAHAYCGHQYGLFAGQLGDGAAMTLGTVEQEDASLLEVQLKGTGPTAFSRAGLDGRKVLRSSIREFLCSEAMYHLGVPTTRAATCMSTQTLVSRDIHHTGEVTQERAAIVTRLAPSFLRIGSLEVCLGPSPDTGLSGPSAGNTGLLTAILDYTINNFYPHLQNLAADVKYVHFYEALVQSSARMVAQWQALGFGHGVINTDNLSLLGLTMDYGPFAFMEMFNPDFVCNASDYWGRYSYRNQPEAVRWGLERLAAVLHLVLPPGELTEKLAAFSDIYEAHYLSLMRQKLGLTTQDADDAALVADLLDTMQHTGADFSCTFRALADHTDTNTALEHILSTCLSGLDTMKDIYKVVPKVLPVKLQRSLTVLETQGHLLGQYLEASHRSTEQLNQRPIIAWVQSLTAEMKAQSDRTRWTAWMSRYSRRLKKAPGDVPGERKAMMQGANPRFILRNRQLHEAIQAASNGDITPCQVLYTLSSVPYHANPSELFEAVSSEHQVAVRILESHDAIDSRQRPLHIT